VVHSRFHTEWSIVNRLNQRLLKLCTAKAARTFLYGSECRSLPNEQVGRTGTSRLFFVRETTQTMTEHTRKKVLGKNLDQQMSILKEFI
jgi:hypothetical protein